LLWRGRRRGLHDWFRAARRRRAAGAHRLGVAGSCGRARRWGCARGGGAASARGGRPINQSEMPGCRVLVRPARARPAAGHPWADSRLPILPAFPGIIAQLEGLNSARLPRGHTRPRAALKTATAPRGLLGPRAVV
jgi:hypothetical protein